MASGHSRFVLRRFLLLFVPMLLTFAACRVSLSFYPDTDLYIGGYNIHHLYTGLVLMTMAGIPLALRIKDPRKEDACTLFFGVGLGLAVDEFVFLIATDGSNASYLLPVSFWGGLIAVSLVSLYACIVALFVSQR